MSTVQDVLKILRSHGDNPEEMEQVLMDLQKEEQTKLKDLRVTLIDQLDCPNKCEILTDYYEMLKIASLAPQVETDKPVGNDWRIYLWGKARRTNKHLIEWCLDAVKNGKLPKRVDENGNLYIYVNDLLPCKGQFYKHAIQTDTISIMSILRNSLIANGEVKRLADQIIQDGAPNIKYNYLPELRMGRLGYVAFYNIRGVEPYLKAVGLGGWIEDYMYNIKV